MALTVEELRKAQEHLALAHLYLREGFAVDGVQDLYDRARQLEVDVAAARSRATGGRE